MYLFTTISIIKGIRYLFIEKWGFNNQHRNLCKTHEQSFDPDFYIHSHQQWWAPNLNIFFCVSQLLSMIQWSYSVV